MSRTIIAGAGQAGGRCALTLRTKGYTGEILLIGEESHPPYRRPPLSKTVLLGENQVADGYLRSREEYAAQGIELQLDACVAEIDVERHAVRTAGGERRGFDHLVLATGASPRKLPIPGVDLAGVMLLRTADDAEAIRARLQPGLRLVVIGGGFIGLEVAASARQLGVEVTLLEAQSRILARSLPEVAAEAVARVHVEHGVEIRCGVQLESIQGRDAVRSLSLAGGEVLGADLVVVGIGITPNTALAAAAGIAVEDGIRVDEFGRSSVDRVLAAGDCAACYVPRYRRHLRFESFQNADQQGANVAATLAGEAATYDPVPFVWSDQHRRVLQIAGFPGQGDRHVQRGSVDAQNLVLFSFAGPRLVGVTGWGQGRAIARDVRFTQGLIQKGIDLDTGRLADPGVALKELVAKDTP